MSRSNDMVSSWSRYLHHTPRMLMMSVAQLTIDSMPPTDDITTNNCQIFIVGLMNRVAPGSSLAKANDSLQWDAVYVSLATSVTMKEVSCLNQT